MSLSGEQAFPSRVILCGGFGRVLEMLGSRGVSVNEIWPCVPWPPSRPLHAMPLRITRNSHRPRASDRTMVATSTSLAYRSFELDSIATVRAGNLRAWAISQASPEKRNFSGLDLEKQIAPPVEAELFS